MTFVLTPRFAPAYEASQCSPFGFRVPVSRPTCTYRVARSRPQRPQYSPFNHFFSQVDQLLGEIDQEAQRQANIEAQREAHRQRQQRERAPRAKFDVEQIEQGWQVSGEFQGFDQENISIEVTDEHTVKISGNTHWQSEKKVEQSQDKPGIESETVHEQQPAQDVLEDKMDGVTLNEPEFETVSATEAADSDTESHKSYQATVEDDFEDLGAETSSLISSMSRTPAEVTEPKGKEKAVEEPAVSEPQIVAPAHQELQQGPKEEERVHGSFERTFRFPERIDAAQVSASFTQGALKITVPRAQVQQVRRIAIL